MSITWQQPADVLVERAPATWHGLWTLLYAAGHATHTLALTVPMIEGLDLTLAAMDLHQAREELEWVHPELADQAPAVSLGLLPARDDVDAARAVVDQLVLAALDRIADLAPTGDLNSPDEAALLAANRALRSARTVTARP
ncbi:hypothetical protein [Actinotalea sp.]|uniref:hypothetical protein n=1 Tax=Actinotalea sp. TaxID=1872145 RepID=UPI00356A94F1